MITFNRIYKSYGKIVALKNLSFAINAGEVFGLLGPNGAGKTTAVHIMAGIFPADRGAVLLDGVPMNQRPRARRKIGIAPQALSLYENLTARENLMFFGKLFGLWGTKLKQAVARALEFVQLTELANRRVKTLSGGMKRRLNLAAALVHDPEILILDEPTVGVDAQSRNAILENILALKSQGKTIVYTTHYMEEAQRLCDRVAIVDRGELKALGPVDALIDQYGEGAVLEVETLRGWQTFRSVDPLSVLQELQEKETILRFRLERANLEDVFLTLTGHSLRDTL